MSNCTQCGTPDGLWARVTELKKALKPMVDAFEAYEAGDDPLVHITVADLRKAAEAYRDKKQG